MVHLVRSVQMYQLDLKVLALLLGHLGLLLHDFQIAQMARSGPMVRYLPVGLMGQMGHLDRMGLKDRVDLFHQVTPKAQTDQGLLSDRSDRSVQRGLTGPVIHSVLRGQVILKAQFVRIALVGRLFLGTHLDQVNH